MLSTMFFNFWLIFEQVCYYMRHFPPTSQVGSIQILLKKGNTNCVVACMSHEGRCPWDSVDSNEGASETVLT